MRNFLVLVPHAFFGMLMSGLHCSKNRKVFFFFPAKVYIRCIFKVRLLPVSFIPKEMSKHLKDKLSEMEGRWTHVYGSYFMS